MKGIFFRRFGIAVHAEQWELKNTFMCQLWYVGRLRVILNKKIFPEIIFTGLESERSQPLSMLWLLNLFSMQKKMLTVTRSRLYTVPL